jgi:hypothetical protein
MRLLFVKDWDVVTVWNNFFVVISSTIENSKIIMLTLKAVFHIVVSICTSYSAVYTSYCCNNAFLLAKGKGNVSNKRVWTSSLYLIFINWSLRPLKNQQLEHQRERSKMGFCSNPAQSDLILSLFFHSPPLLITLLVLAAHCRELYL